MIFNLKLLICKTLNSTKNTYKCTFWLLYYFFKDHLPITCAIKKSQLCVSMRHTNTIYLFIL